jgi:hypothetical protein
LQNGNQVKLAASALGTLALLCSCAAPQQSALEPKHSEKSSAAATVSASKRWTPRILAPGAPDYLPDFSYAGYRQGEAPLPRAAITHAIADFGAKPDDAQDDTAAFRKALAHLGSTAGPVVLALERGHYILSDVLFVERSDIVLRGAGSEAGGTVLELRRPLDELPRAPVISELESYLRKNNKLVDGKPFSAFSWTGGLIWTRRPGNPRSAPSGGAQQGRRGQRSVRITGQVPTAGSLIEVRWFNRFGQRSPVLSHVFGLTGAIPGERLADPERVLTSQLLNVARVEGETLWVEQPLRHDLEPAWEAVWAPAPERLTGVGLEHFRIELPDAPYAGHHLERGYNALYLTDLRDSWVRDLAIHNADSAILSDDSERLTLTGISLTGRNGHYGIHLGDVEQVLVRNFDVEAHFEHSLSFNTGSRASVFSRGVVQNPHLDQHRGRNHQNLFDAIAGIDEGSTSRLFEHGGADYWGPAHGAFNTFWNISLDVKGAGERSLLLSGVRDAGPARLVGLHANVPLQIDYPGAYQEGIGKPDIAVPSLYDEQLQRRLGSR